jgi:hypothetical protein
MTMHGVTGSAAGGGYSTALDLLAYVNAVRAGRFPGAEPEMGITGGAPGINASVEARGDWVVIVLTNLDPPGDADRLVARRRAGALRFPSRRERRSQRESSRRSVFSNT